jgi:hypothetical protein
MNGFFDAWKRGVLLERHDIFPTVRPFTIAVVEHWLRTHVPAVGDADLQELRRLALMAHLRDGQWLPSGATDSWDVPGLDGWRLVIKAFGEHFQEYDSVSLLVGGGQLFASVKVTMQPTGDGVRLLDVYVGVFPHEGQALRTTFRRLQPEDFPLVLPADAPPLTKGESTGIYPTPYMGARWAAGDAASEEDLIAQAAEVLETVRRKVAEDPKPLRLGTEARAMAKVEGLSAEAVREALGQEGFRFSAAQIATFYAALKAKGFVLLSGLSGTGKTALAARLLRLLGIPESHVLLAPVRPDWRDTSSLLGFANPLTKEYQATPLLRFLLDAQANFQGDAQPLVEFLRTYLDDEEATAWYPRYKSTVEHFAARTQSASGRDTQALLAGTTQRWTVEDLQLLWHRRNNGVADVGQAPKLDVEDSVLADATDMLADRSQSHGARFLAALHRLRDATGINHVARTARVLATLDPEHVPPEAGEAQTRIILNALASPLKYAPTGKDVTPQALEDVWSFSTAKAADLLSVVGRDPEDPYLRGIALWGVQRWARQGASIDAQAKPAPYVVILDEMNLARVEYYFADFLSAMESERDADGLHDAEIVLHGAGDLLDQHRQPVPESLRLPPNLYFVGTVNVDESTFSFSPKVLDRAFTLEFRDVDLVGYPMKPMENTADPFDLPTDFVRGGHFAGVDKRDVYAQAHEEPEVLELLADLNARLGSVGLEFGYRVVDEILQFLAALREAPLSDGLPRDEPGDTAFDAALRMKVLPKFHGPFRPLAPGLDAIRTWAVEHRFDGTVGKVDDMIRRGTLQGHVSFF